MGCVIDAIPAMIIVGNLMLPLAERVHMHPGHCAIIGVVALAFAIFFPNVILFFPRLIMPKFV